MAQGGRVVCPKCGSNNFDTVSVCWKCGGMLNSGASGYSPQPPQRQNVPVDVPQQSYAPDAYGYRTAPAQVNSGDSGKANRAAFWLGMTMPYFGLPIGLAFMMCDDRRRQEVGRLCIIWSTLSGIVHLLFTVASFIGMSRYIAGVLPALKATAGQRGLGGGLDGM